LHKVLHCTVAKDKYSKQLLCFICVSCKFRV